MYTGEAVMSTVRRPSTHREYIRNINVSKQTTIIRLQGSSALGDALELINNNGYNHSTCVRR